MHGKEMANHVAVMVGDPAMDQVYRQELNAWLNAAQDLLGHLLVDVEAWAFQIVTSLNTTSGTATITLPEDFDEAVHVRYNSDNTSLRAAHFLPNRDRSALDTNLLYAATAAEPFYRLLGNTMVLHPTPTATVTGGVELTYRRYPLPLTLDRELEGLTLSSDGNDGGTTIVDTALTQRDDFWNEAMVVITSGAYAGQRRIVSDFVASTDTLTVRNAFGGKILSAVTFSLYDHSIIPQQHHVHLVNYAAAMALQKLRRPQEATAKMAEFAAGLDAIRQRYGAPIQHKMFDAESDSKVNP